jgi:hypothetical protein
MKVKSFIDFIRNNCDPEAEIAFYDRAGERILGVSDYCHVKKSTENGYNYIPLGPVRHENYRACDIISFISDNGDLDVKEVINEAGAQGHDKKKYLANAILSRYCCSKYVSIKVAEYFLSPDLVL